MLELTPTEDFYCDYVLNGKISVKIAMETDRILAFCHTRPSYELHLVIVPKKHIAKLIEINDFSLISDIFEIATKLIKNLDLDQKDFRIITNGGTNQDSKHLHFHLVSGKKLTRE